MRKIFQSSYLLQWTQNRKQTEQNNIRVDTEYGNRTEERQETFNYDYQVNCDPF